MPRLHVTHVSAVLLLAALLACGGKSDSKATPSAAPAKKVFTFARANVHRSLDPVKQFDEASGELIKQVYDSLLEYHYLKRPYELIPNLLAKLPEASADGMTYSFELRPGVRFADDPCFPGGKGRVLGADDVLYSLHRFADAKINVQSYSLMAGFVAGMDEFHEQSRAGGIDYAKTPISGLKKLDELRFTLTLTRPNPLALFPLATAMLSIVPREAVEHYRSEFEHHPVGTGPFRIKALSRRGVIVLVKNPNYHMTYPTQGAPGDAEKGLLASAGKRLPLIDELQLPLIEEPQPQMLKFLNGEIEWVAIGRDNFSTMAYKDDRGFHLKPEYAKKFEIYAEPGLSTEYLGFNMKDPLVGKNRALRQAIAYALDTPRFLKEMRNGRGLPLKTLVPIPIAGSERDVPAEWYGHDLEAAKKKLAEAGYPNGKGLPPLTIEYRSQANQVRQDHEFDRALLAQIGVTLKANFQTFSAFTQRMDAANFQLADLGWQADYPDAENFYQLLYGPNKPPLPNNVSYANPEYDALYEKIRLMQNGPERFALFARMNELIRQDLPIIFTWNFVAVGLHQRWVRNFKRNIMNGEPFKYLDVDLAAKRKAP